MTRLGMLIALVGWGLPLSAAAAPCTGPADCPPTMPVCNVITGICGPCVANTDCGVDPTKPACSAGACTACTGSAGCVGHTGTVCSLSGPSSGQCVECAGNADCSDAKPICTSNVCGTCSGAGGETACMASHGGKHCEPSGALAGTCVACRSTNSSADCSAATPVCNAADVCTGCTPTDPAASAQCSRFGATTVCTAGGACVACTTDASCPLASAPHCVSNVCGPCNAATVTHGDESCTHFADAGVPACQPNDGVPNTPGACKQCSQSNTTACGASAPACNFQTGACQLCTVAFSDLGGVSTGCASNTNGHACKGSGTSVFCGCNSDADCGGATSGRVCDTLLSQCADGCSRAPSRNNCPAGQFCTTSDVTGATTGICTTTCNFSVDCPAGMPFCLAPDGDAGLGRCAGCRTGADCSGATAVCDPASKVCVECDSDADCGGRTCDVGGSHTCVTALDLAVVLDAGEPDLAVPAPLYVDDGCGGCVVAGSRPLPTGALLVCSILAVWLLRRRRDA